MKSMSFPLFLADEHSFNFSGFFGLTENEQVSHRHGVFQLRIGLGDCVGWIFKRNIVLSRYF